jgi:hypothetical protein
MFEERGDDMKTILQILRGLTLDLPLALREVLRWLCSLIGREAARELNSATYSTARSFRIPNPLIYDQYYL